ncbi:hypothetical protein [Sediminibacterium sp. TEGAF015]|uniref:hypothetical protein n=1 Tax=Sediminibacterium sp. TEGAF015 TaxID=575378 RepID=UPI0021FB9AAA|nr:hypothetical protein [Sediminibacterium sp. TEGAF015]BDQ11923.1 hypothetical protein TEGAF0_11400 [Sediminibacterium sp. TEGAF015]
MKKAGWQIILGLIVFLSAIIISFESENALNSQLWSSLSVIIALFTIHHQAAMPKKENTNE